MALPDAIRFYQRTATDLSLAIPEELKRADYHELYNYYAYELPFILDWGQTQAGNDYFMKKQRGVPADDILQYKAERNARLLFNEVHRNAPMELLAPYKDVIAEANMPSPTPEGTNHQERIQAATDHSQVRARKVVVVGNLLSHHNLPPHLSDGHYRIIQRL